VAAALLVPAIAAAHELDHPGPSFVPAAPPSAVFESGGEGARWELVATIPTGNPHTDLDFFTHDGDTYTSVGTLAAGPNAGGQSIVQLTDGGRVSPRFVAGHPSASCISNPEAALGLQHDVEATPKGGAILNAKNPFADDREAQLLLDATDAEGRCHDQGLLGIEDAPQGGLEIVDITDPAKPVEIGLTSHIGEAHTVNVDPKRPHIAYAVTSDAIGISEDTSDIDGDGNKTELIRENEDPTDSDRFDLDGFEVVDLSSCMGFPTGRSVAQKRARCRPEVYRYRYPSAKIGLGHTQQTGSNGLYGCHELEVYPDDRLTCGGGNALIVFDMSDAFDDNGTPKDFSDDEPRGKPLPCRNRLSSSTGPYMTGATVVDCVDGTGPGEEDLTIPKWLDAGAPSLRGVEYLGSVHHQGRGAGGAATPAFDATEDIDFDHEAELSASGELLLATDERGGGVLPPGASCSEAADNKAGNGGIHAYRVSKLQKRLPDSPKEAFEPYARAPGGGKAIYRAPIRTEAQATVCTAHVFQQIPGQNRIFMGWYSQGTQVVDFVENLDGTVSFKEAGYFIPANANEWVSHIFKVRRNGDGSVTYFGAAGDFNLGESGRNAIDIYKVTLPAPPKPLADPLPSPGTGTGHCKQPLIGSGAADRLFGGPNDDRIRGRGGDDRIRGRRGADCLFGGDGADAVAGSGGGDQIGGGKGRDRLRGEAGRDRLRGGGGRDLLDGGGGRNTLRGEGGRDRLRAGGGHDEVRGGNGNDRIDVRGGGRDVVRCGRGKDAVKAGRRDKLKDCERVERT